MDDIPGPATGAFLTALQMCQVRGFNIMYNKVPLSKDRYFATYALIRPNGRQRLVFEDARGLQQVLDFLEEENGTKSS